MRIRTLTVTAVTAGTIAASAVAGFPASAHAITGIRYAAPAGTGTACTQPAPCAIDVAINDALPFNEVLVEPGNYGTAAAPLTTELQDEGHALVIQGVPGKAMPVIHSAASPALFDESSAVSDLEFLTTGDNSVNLVDSATGTHLIVANLDDNGHACDVFAALADSVCLATGADAVAVDVEIGGTNGGPTNVGTGTLRGVTAESTSATGIGVKVDAGENSTATLDVTNSIFHGGATDVIAHTETPTSTATIALNHSDYASVNSTSPMGSATITGDPSNITTPPTFVNAASFDFAESRGSVTIDHGATDPAGDTDLAGNPRTIGSAPDIGAYEFALPPTTGKVVITKKTPHTVHAMVKVNPKGDPTSVELFAISGTHHFHSRLVSAGAGSSATAVSLVVKGLKPHSKYHVHTVATSSGGHASSPTKTVHTRT
jgi:hypothetical protein